MFPQGGVKVGDLERDMRETFDKVMDGAVPVEAHPFDAERAGGETADMELQMGKILLAGDGRVGGDAEMMVPPAPVVCSQGRFVVLPPGGCSVSAGMLSGRARGFHVHQDITHR